MKKIYLILLFVLNVAVFGQQPIRALRTIMEVEYVPKHYELGTGMIGLGDINSDGKPDFAVSAGAIGKTFIYYGGKGVLDDTVDLIIDGGGTIAKGDLNGDGVLDLVIYMKADSSSSGLARLAVYLGRKDSVIKIDTIPSLLIKEETPGSDFGSIGAFGVGDINNDGYDDLVVGARSYDGARGKLYFYFGKPNISSTPDASAEGDKTDSMYSSYGTSVNIDDINGDGIKDVTIGVDRRRFYDGIWIADTYLDIFYGKKNWNFNKNEFNKRLDKSNAGVDYLWNARLVDINNDGMSDISYAKGDSVYFFLGSQDSVSSKPGMIISNPDTNFYSSFDGLCCYSIGDINNDGKDDFAFRASPGGYSECLIVYLGGTKPQPVAGRCKGFVAGGNPFSPIVPLDDVNGDMINDFGTCAPTDPLPGPDNGYFVILSGDSTFVTSIREENSIPTELHLLQNYPNPFNPVTIITFAIANVETRHASSIRRITLRMYDVLGREIAILLNEEKSPGTYQLEFSAEKYSLSSGVYFVRMEVFEHNSIIYSSTKKLMLLK